MKDQSLPQFGPSYPHVQLAHPIPDKFCPAITPVHVATSVVETPVGRRVMLQCTTPSGVQFYFLDEKLAVTIGNGMLECARIVESGLYLPSTH